MQYLSVLVLYTEGVFVGCWRGWWVFFRAGSWGWDMGKGVGHVDMLWLKVWIGHFLQYCSVLRD